MKVSAQAIASIGVVVACACVGAACEEEDQPRELPPPPLQSTLTATKAGDGTGIVRTLPAGLICDVECAEDAHVYEDVAEVVVVAEPSRTANFKKLTCTAGDRVLSVDALTTDTDARLTLPTIEDAAGEDAAVDWSCVADFLQVQTLQVIANAPTNTGSGRVRGALSAVVGADEPKRMDCPSTQTCVAAYFANEVETLTAVADPGSVFAGWQFCADDTAAAVITLTLDDDINCRPTFNLE